MRKPLLSTGARALCLAATGVALAQQQNQDEEAQMGPGVFIELKANAKDAVEVFMR